MILFFNIAMSIGFIMMSIIVLAHQTMFEYIFKKLKKIRPMFLKSKIDRHSYFDEKTEFALAVLKGIAVSKTKTFGKILIYSLG